jgi:transglutaminase-like putative cysteine protease
MRILFLLLAAVWSSHAAEVTVPIAPPADWVELSAEPSLAPTPAEDASYGQDYRLLDRQVNVHEASSYHRIVYRITSDSALQDGGRLSWDFDPAYQQLTLHHVNVTRDGVTEKRLRPEVIKVIQQERDLDRHMLNGELTALIVLEDVRVGDVIDYAYSRHGWNPAFGGRYFDSIAAGWSVPVRHHRVRVTAPASRPIQAKSFGPVSLTFNTRMEGDNQVMTWEGRDMKAIASESELPSWFTPYPVIRVSEFTQWSEVVKWAEPLYAVADPLAPQLVEKARALTRGLADDGEKAVAILQFVQQEIRYLGMELGAGSYRPSAPEVVLARRFGDCKDKTLLFCTLLRAVGVTAYPALLDTDWRDTIDGWLPSPYAFDHVIACWPRAEGNVFFDPTLTQQQGGWERRGLPDYGRALLVKAGETGLTVITVPPMARSRVRVLEEFKVADFERPARFTVKTTYTGLSADSERGYFSRTKAEEIAKRFVNYYASAYPGLTSVSVPTLEDDPKTNTVTVNESYDVPKLWVQQSDARKIKAEFYPKVITDYAVRPETIVRSMPLRISHPADVELTTKVILPETWNVTPAQTVVDSHAFRATEGITGEGKEVTMKYRWETRADHVPVEHVTQHVQDINRFRDAVGYTLTYTKPAPAEPVAVAKPKRFELNWKLLLVTATTFAMTAYAGSWSWRREYVTPPPLPSDPNLSGIGGWLLLVAFGVTLRPLVLLGSIAGTLRQTFDQSFWAAITTPGSAAYQKGLGLLIVAEMIGNTVMLAGAAVMIGLFYNRKRGFPVFFIVMAVFTFVFLALDSVAAAYLVKADAKVLAESYRLVAQAAGQAVIWIPYMCVSRRVRATFVR